MKKVIIISVFAAVAIIALFVFLNMSTGATKEVVEPNKKRIAQKEAVVVTQKVEKVENKKEASKVEYVKKPGQMQLPDGKILTFPPPKKGETAKVYANGHLYECDHEGNFKDVTRRRLFDTAFEGNLLAMANGENYISAFVVGLDEAQVKELLQKGYEAKGDETEEELARIAAYNEMREAALAYMKDGGKFNDFITDLVEFDKKERAAQITSFSTIMNLVKKGKIQEAKDMATAAEMVLKEKGFKPMRLPPHIQKLLGVEASK